MKGLVMSADQIAYAANVMEIIGGCVATMGGAYMTLKFITRIRIKVSIDPDQPN
jgi:hypothetical protein